MAPSKKDNKHDWESWFERFFDRDGISSATSEMKKSTQATLSAFANKFHLVSHEEFQAQQKVLAQALKKLESIEARLEKMAGGKPAKKASKKKPAAKPKAKTAKRKS